MVDGSLPGQQIQELMGAHVDKNDKDSKKKTTRNRRTIRKQHDSSNDTPNAKTCHHDHGRHNGRGTCKKSVRKNCRVMIPIWSGVTSWRARDDKPLSSTERGRGLHSHCYRLRRRVRRREHDLQAEKVLGTGLLPQARKCGTGFVQITKIRTDPPATTPDTHTLWKPARR